MNEKTAWYLGVGREKTALVGGLGKFVSTAYNMGRAGSKIAPAAKGSMTLGQRGASALGEFAGKSPLKAMGAAAGATGATGLAAGAAAGSAHEKNKPFMSRLMGR